jgi:glycosyltransferase involved in cell wall biosynthesis
VGREVSGVRLRLISNRFEPCGPLSAMSVIETVWNHAAEIEALVAADVGISWVPGDVWSRGKCAIKLVQHGAARLPTIANPMGVHPEIIRAGFNGILADTDDEWIAAVRRLASDPELRHAMGRNARAAIERTYSVAVQADAFVSAVVK